MPAIRLWQDRQAIVRWINAFGAIARGENVGDAPLGQRIGDRIAPFASDIHIENSGIGCLLAPADPTGCSWNSDWYVGRPVGARVSIAPMPAIDRIAISKRLTLQSQEQGND